MSTSGPQNKKKGSKPIINDLSSSSQNMMKETNKEQDATNIQIPDNRLTKIDIPLLDALVDLRTIVSTYNPVKGQVVCLIGHSLTGQIVSWGFVRSLTAVKSSSAAATQQQDATSGHNSHNNPPPKKKKRKLSGHNTDIHAEMDALTALMAGLGSCSFEIKMSELTVYVTSACCKDCFSCLVNAGIRRIVYPQPKTAGYYETHRNPSKHMATVHGVEIIETTRPLIPFRKLDEIQFCQSLPDLPRAWGAGGNFVQLVLTRQQQGQAAAVSAGAVASNKGSNEKEGDDAP